MGMAAPTATNMGPPPMHTDPKLLTLVQWLSPNFPLASFTYSHGLEAAIAAGWVKDGATLETWLRDLLHHGSGRCDAIWLRAAFAADTAEALVTLDAEARAFAPAATRLREGAGQGAAFTRLVREVWQIDLPDLLLPLAVGAATRRAQMDLETALPLFLSGFVSNLVAAAQRLMPLGQTQAQAIVARLHDDCTQVATETKGATPEDIWATAFLSDIAAMHHETLQPRLFQS